MAYPTYILDQVHGTWKRHIFLLIDDDGLPIDMSDPDKSVTAYFIRYADDSTSLLTIDLTEGLTTGVGYLTIADTDFTDVNQPDVLTGSLQYRATLAGPPQSVGTIILKVSINPSR